MGRGITLREYQKNIINSILQKGNTLVVLPTGTGKTIIAFYLLDYFKEGVFLAPTKPLIKQHYENFLKFFPEYKNETSLIIGEIQKPKREKLFNKKFVFATPQTIEKEVEKLQRKIYIFDECHRTVGKYSYANISKKLREGVLKIGLTASPGGNKEKIEEVLRNLNINNVEIRTGKEEDISKYIINKEYGWEFVSLTPSLREIISLLKEDIKKYKEWFLRNKIRIPSTKKELIAFRSKLNNIPKPLYYSASSYYSILFNLIYLLEFIETQGYHYFLEYINKIKSRKTKASKHLISSQNIRKAIHIAQNEVKENKYHPKFYKLREILLRNKDTKTIVFFQYISTIELAKKFLEGFPNLFVLVGKRKGFGRKEQLKSIEEFRKKESAVLLSSSVGEEGLDIPKVDVVVFFDVVPSEIRSIQRKGRAGRMREGKVYFIITQNTIEVAFYKAAKRKERIMKSKLIEMNKRELKTIETKEKNTKNESKEDKEETKTNKAKNKSILDYF